MKTKNILAVSIASLLSVNLLGCSDKNNSVFNGYETPLMSVNPAEDEISDSDLSLAPSFGVVIKGLNYPTEYNPEGWQSAYQTKCNLSIESSEEEFIERAQRIADKYGYTVAFGKPDGKNIKHAVFYRNDANKKMTGLQIYLSSYLKGDYSDGRTYLGGDPGRYVDTYYDYSGKFILYTYYEFDNAMRDFMEPIFTEVTIHVNGGEDEEIHYSTKDPAEIEGYLDAFHTFRANLKGDEAPGYTPDDAKYNIIFTSNEGIEYIYSFDEGDYMHYDSKLYHLSNADLLKDITDNLMGIENEEKTTVALSEISFKEATADDIETTDDGIKYVRNQLLISANLDSRYEDVSSLCDEYGFEIVGYLEITKDYQIEFKDSKSFDELNKLILEFAAMDFVSNCSLNYADSVTFD